MYDKNKAILMEKKKGLWATLWESMTKTGGCCGGGGGCGPSNEDAGDAVEKDTEESDGGKVAQ
jgi:hypothetical protein